MHDLEFVGVGMPEFQDVPLIRLEVAVKHPAIRRRCGLARMFRNPTAKIRKYCRLGVTLENYRHCLSLVQSTSAFDA